MNTDQALAEIYHHLERWRRWYRARRALAWGLHGLVLLLALSLLSGTVLLFGARLLPAEFLRLLAISSMAGLLGGLGIGFVWPFPRTRAARFFDLRFNLAERISTALELATLHTANRPNAEGAWEPYGSLAPRQIEDARTAAREVNPRALLPFRPRLPEIFFILILFAMAPLFLQLAQPAIQAAQNQREVQEAIDEEAGRLEELISEIEADPELSEEHRRALIEPLEEALQELNQATSLENALSALTEAGDELQRLQQQPDLAQARDLQAAGARLRDQLSSGGDNPLEAFNQALSAGDYEAAAQALRNLEIRESTPEEALAQAEIFEAAAQSLQGANPELAEGLRSAAGALRTGQVQAARAALDRAAQSLSIVSQANAADQAADQAFTQLVAGQNRLSGGSGSQAMEGLGSGTGQSGSGSGTSGQGNQSGSGAGQGEGGGDSQSGQQTGSGPISSNNAPGDGGERPYDPVYAPQRLGGEGGEELGLPGSEGSGGQTIGQGAQQPGAPGSSQVPYSEVYSDYAVDYYRAIANGQVPAGLRDLVRDYFSSLAPR